MDQINPWYNARDEMELNYYSHLSWNLAAVLKLTLLSTPYFD